MASKTRTAPDAPRDVTDLENLPQPEVDGREQIILDHPVDYPDLLDVEVVAEVLGAAVSEIDSLEPHEQGTLVRSGGAVQVVTPDLEIITVLGPRTHHNDRAARDAFKGPEPKYEAGELEHASSRADALAGIVADLTSEGYLDEETAAVVLERLTGQPAPTDAGVDNDARIQD